MEEAVKGYVTVRKTTPCAQCNVKIIVSSTQGMQAYRVSKGTTKITPLCSTSCRDKVANDLADEE